MSISRFFSDVYGQEIVGYDDFIFKNVKIQNTLWEEDICNIIVDNLKNNTEFIDIGANIGLISLAVNKIANEKGKTISNIHCFECDINTFTMLNHNVFNINNIVKLYPFALADRSQLCLMSTNHYNKGCNFIYSTCHFESTCNYNYPFIPLSNDYDKIKYIPSIPLDDIRYQFSNIGVIKIDVEGFEYFVLLGAKETILKHKPVIIIEIWDFNKDKIVDLFVNVFNYDISLINEQNYICKPIN